MERRILTARRTTLEKRVDGTPIIAGYAAVFYDADDPGTEYELIPGLRERVMPTAFDRCLREGADVRGLFNHDPNHLMGRMSSGTMKCSTDKTGLKYEITPPDTQAARDVCEMLKRGDLTGSSFSFAIRQQKFVFNDDGDEDDVRELHDVDLYDVGPVSFPAYDSTTAGMRALELSAEVRSAWQTAKGERRGAVIYAAGPVIDSDKWDASAALGRIQSWASSGDVMDYPKYRRAFAWFDSENAETMGVYKLPHHDVQNGELKVHKKGVQAAMAALLGSRGGTDIPDDERKAVYSHLERHYQAMDLEPPEFKAARAAVAFSRERMRMRQRLAEVR